MPLRPMQAIAVLDKRERRVVLMGIPPLGEIAALQVEAEGIKWCWQGRGHQTR